MVKGEGFFEQISCLFHFIRFNFYKSLTPKDSPILSKSTNFTKPLVLLNVTLQSGTGEYIKNIYEKIICSKFSLETTPRPDFYFGILPSPINPSKKLLR